MDEGTGKEETPPLARDDSFAGNATDDMHVSLQSSQAADEPVTADESYLSADSNDPSEKGDGERDEHVKEKQTESEDAEQELISLTEETNSTNTMEGDADTITSVSQCSVLTDAYRETDGSSMETTEAPGVISDEGPERKAVERKARTGIPTPKGTKIPEKSKVPLSHGRLPKQDPGTAANVKKKASDSRSIKLPANALTKTIKHPTSLKRNTHGDATAIPLAHSENESHQGGEEINRKMATSPHLESTSGQDSEHCQCEHSKLLALQKLAISKENVKIKDEVVRERAKREAAEKEQKVAEEKLKPIKEMYSKLLNERRVLKMKADDSVKLLERNKELKGDVARAAEDLSKVTNELAAVNQELAKTREELVNAKEKLSKLQDDLDRSRRALAKLKMEEKQKLDEMEQKMEEVKVSAQQSIQAAEDKHRLMYEEARREAEDQLRQRSIELEDACRQRDIEAQQKLEEAEHTIIQAREEASEHQERLQAMEEEVRLAQEETARMRSGIFVVKKESGDRGLMTKEERQMEEKAEQRAREIEEKAKQEVREACAKVEELVIQIKEHEKMAAQRELELMHRNEEYEQRLQEYEQRLQELEELQQRSKENEQMIQELEELQQWSEKNEQTIQELEELQQWSEKNEQTIQELEELRHMNEQRIKELEEFIIEQDTEMVWEPNTKISQLEAELSAHTIKENELMAALEEARDEIAALTAVKADSRWRHEHIQGRGEGRGIHPFEHPGSEEVEEDDSLAAAAKALDELYSMTETLSTGLKEDETKVISSQQQQQSVIATLQNQLSKKEQQLKDYKDRSLKLRRSSDAHQDCILRLEQAKRLSKEEIDNLQRTLAEAVHSNEVQQNMVTRYREQSQGLIQEVEALKGQLLLREKDVKALTGQLSRSELDLKALANKLPQKDLLTEQLSQAKQDVESLTDQLSHKEQDIHTLSDQLSQKEQDIHTLSDQLSHKEQDIRTLSDQLSQKEQDIRTLSDQLSHKEQDIRTLSDQLSQKEQDIRTLSDQLSHKEQDIRTLFDQLSQKEQDIHTLSDQLSHKEQDIHTLSDQLSHKEQDIHTLSDQLSQKEQNIHTLMDQLSHPATISDQLSHKGQDASDHNLSNQLALEKQKVVSLTDSLSQKELDRATLVYELSLKESDLAALTDQLSLRKHENITLESQLTQRGREMESLSDQLSQKEQDIETLTVKLTQRDRENKILKNQLSEKEQQISALTSQLNSTPRSTDEKISLTPHPTLESEQRSLPSSPANRPRQKSHPQKAVQSPGLAMEGAQPSMVVYPHRITHSSGPGHQVPTATEESRIYVAVLDYDPASLCSTGRPDLELALPTGAIVEVHGEMSPQGYYEASFRGRRGLVPANFVQELDVPDLSARRRLFNQTLPSSRAPSSRPGSAHSSMVPLPATTHTHTLQKSQPCKDGYRMFVAEYDYSPEAECNELAFKEGNRIKVFGHEMENGYYNAELDGKRGLVPARFLREEASPAEDEDRRSDGSKPTVTTPDQKRRWDRISTHESPKKQLRYSLGGSSNDRRT